MTVKSIARLVAVAALVALLTPSVAVAGDAAAGKEKYDIFCATCHGPTGKGDGPVAAALDPKPRDLSKGEFIFDANKDGKTGTDDDIKNWREK